MIYLKISERSNQYSKFERQEISDQSNQNSKMKDRKWFYSEDLLADYILAASVKKKVGDQLDYD